MGGIVVNYSVVVYRTLYSFVYGDGTILIGRERQAMVAMDFSQSDCSVRFYKVLRTCRLAHSKSYRSSRRFVTMF